MGDGSKVILFENRGREEDYKGRDEILFGRKNIDILHKICIRRGQGFGFPI